MKKVIAVLALALSTGAFAVNQYEGMSKDTNKGHHMSTRQELTQEEQNEYRELYDGYRLEMQGYDLEKETIELDMKKEMLASTPNKSMMEKLIDKKVAIRAKMEKARLSFKLEAKERFGMDMRHGMNHGKSHKKGGCRG